MEYLINFDKMRSSSNQINQFSIMKFDETPNSRAVRAGTDNQRRTPEKVSTIVLVRNALFLHGFKFLVIIFLIY